VKRSFRARPKKSAEGFAFARKSRLVLEKRECGEIRSACGEKVNKKEREMKSVRVDNKVLVGLLVVTFRLIGEILSREFELGPCYLQFLEPCANNSIQFFLFSSDEPNEPPLRLDNIFPELPTDINETSTKSFKMIIHGYGGHLDFNGSKQIRKGEV
jgi:hypothetical protein